MKRLFTLLTLFTALFSFTGVSAQTSDVVSDIYVYTYDTYGNPIRNIPTDGTDVNLTVQIRFKNEFCSYVVAVYDNDMRLINTALHTPDNTNRLESEFINLKTKYYTNGEICIMKVSDFDTFTPVGDKTYTDFNLNGNKIPETLYFKNWDIEESTDSSVTISGTTYSLTNTTEYIKDYMLNSEFDMYDDYYSAEILDGNIIRLYSANSSVKTIVTANERYIVDDDGKMYETSSIIADFKPANGDVVIMDMYADKYRLTKARKLSGVITETAEYYDFVTDDNVYTLDCRVDPFFFSGEICFGYNNYYSNDINLLEKDYSKKLPVFSKDYSDKYLYIYGGIIDTRDAVPVGYTTYESFGLYFLSDGNGVTYIESMPEIPVDKTVKYNAITNSINGYLLDENTKIFGLGTTLHTMPMKDSSFYNAKLYSADGIHIDYVIYRDPADSAVCEDVYMLVDEFKYNSFFGYVDGKYKSIESDIENYYYECALVKLSVNSLTNKAVKCQIICSNDKFGQDKPNSNPSGVIELPVSEIYGNVITLDNNGERFAFKISSDTHIYKYETENDFLDAAKIEDINYNPVLTNHSDRVMIYYNNYIADTVLIIQ